MLIRGRRSPWPLVREISWSVPPLVAGLFVLVEALGRTGVITALAGLLDHTGQSAATGWVAGIGVALASNVMNNLPVGLIAGSAVQNADAERIARAVLIGVDVGPNLSITGSLATILWLSALRREGEAVSAARLKLGLLVMPRPCSSRSAPFCCFPDAGDSHGKHQHNMDLPDYFGGRNFAGLGDRR